MGIHTVLKQNADHSMLYISTKIHQTEAGFGDHKKKQKTEHLNIYTWEMHHHSLFNRSEQTKAQESKAKITYKAYLTCIIIITGGQKRCMYVWKAKYSKLK